MICISITAPSNRFAVVDMYNAAPQCDLMELRLDRLEHAPDLTLLMEMRQKPVLVSCRRKRDGGNWEGSEEQRLMLLRQAMADGADYVELELDIAGKVPRYGKSKRVISVTSVDKPMRHAEDYYAKALKLDADVVKLTGPTNTLEEAWPMLRVLSKREVPCVAVGIGEPGLTLSILGRKLKSPWLYAALEQGMEAHPGQATVSELRDIFHYESIKSRTPMLGVSGFNPRQKLAICLLNGAFRHLGLDLRCLPMEIGNLSKFEKLMGALQVESVILDVEHRSKILEVVTKLEESAKQCRQADLLLKQEDGWHGYNTVWRSAVRALEDRLRAKTGEEKPLEGRTVLIGGADATARAVAYGIMQRGALIIVTSHDEDRAVLLAQMYQCRYLPATHIYSAYADCVVCLEEDQMPDDPEDLPKPLIETSYIRPTLTVMDLRNIPEDTSLVAEARIRKSTLVEPLDIFMEQLRQQIRGITDKQVTLELMRSWLGG
jgi:3-dehydroquinate dehydratase/shikimate dehydrogenase